MNQIAILAALFIGLPFTEFDDGNGKTEPVPKVELLHDYLSGGEKLPKDMPVLAKGNIHIVYKCSSVDALKGANLRYRVIPVGHDLKAKPIPWRSQRLVEKEGKPEWGKFDIDRGVFENSGPIDEIHFHAMGGEKPRRVGGGRIVFLSRGENEAKSGAKFEYFIEVFDHKHAKPGVSEICVIAIVTEREFFAWLQSRRQEDQRIRELEKKQKKVFPGK